MRQLTQQELEALKMLGALTRGRFDIWALAGPANVKARTAIMALVVGHPVKQSQSGVTALREAFNCMAHVTGDCIAVREDAFVKWAKEMVAGS